MPSLTVTDHCPHWCSRDHSADPCGTAFYHASETASVAIARPGGLTAPDRLDVQTAQYLPDDPAEPAWSPTVEIAVHAGPRYRLIGLTPQEARDLAALLARAADVTMASGGCPDLQAREESGAPRSGAAGPAGSARGASPGLLRPFVRYRRDPRPSGRGVVISPSAGAGRS